MAANSFGDTDFTIQIAQYKWKVHAATLSKACRCFDMACNGSFREGETRMVSLEETPRDFARLLQFVYTHAYDRKPGDSTASWAVPLRPFVSEDELLLERWDTEEAREKLDIDKSALELARKYDCKSLREFIVTRLVVNLPYSRDFGGDFAFSEFQAELVKVFQVISADLEEMPKLHERLADEAFNFWVMKYDAESKTIPPLFGVGDPTTCTDLQRQLQRLVKDNGSFAFEMVKGALRIASYGFEKFKWSGVRISDLRHNRHYPGAPGQLYTYSR